MSLWKLDSKKVLFLGIPKNASTTIRKTIKMQQLNESDDTFNDFQGKGYTTFTVLRNPIERLVSGYAEIIYRERSIGNRVLKKLGYGKESAILIGTADNTKKFKLFLSMIYDGLDEQHIRPQVNFIKNLKIDRYLNFKFIEKDFNSFCMEHKIKLSPLMHINKTKSNKAYENATAYILSSPKVLDNLLCHYEKDWKLYNSCNYSYSQ